MLTHCLPRVYTRSARLWKAKKKRISLSSLSCPPIVARQLTSSWSRHWPSRMRFLYSQSIKGRPWANGWEFANTTSRKTSERKESVQVWPSRSSLLKSRQRKKRSLRRSLQLDWLYLTWFNGRTCFVWEYIDRWDHATLRAHRVVLWVDVDRLPPHSL